MFFNSNKKKIEKLNGRIEYYKDQAERLKSENEKLKKQLAGDRICSNYCRVCKNGIADGYFGYSCVLECHCKDFKSTKETHWLSIPPSTPLLGD